MTTSQARWFSKRKDGTAGSTIMPRAAIAQKLTRFSSAQAPIQAVVHADAQAASDLCRETLNDPTIPARILTRNGRDLNKPGMLLNSLSQQRVFVEENEVLIERVQEQLSLQEKQGGRSLLLVDRADLMHAACLDELKQVCEASELRAALFGPLSLIAKLRRIGSSVEIMTIAGGDFPAATPQPEDAEKTQDWDPTEEFIAVPEAAHRWGGIDDQEALRRVALTTLFVGAGIGIAIGWIGHSVRSQAASEPEPLLAVTETAPSIAEVPEPASKQRSESQLQRQPQQIKPPQIEPALQMAVAAKEVPAEAAVEEEVAAKPEPTQAAQPLAPQEKVIDQVESAEPLQGTPWLMTQNAEHYTLQLLATSSREGLQGALEQYSSVPNMHWYTAQNDEKTHHVLLYGVFKTHSEASAALQELPAALEGFNPWLRSLRVLQSQAVEAEREST